MKKYPKKLKFAIILISLAIGVSTYFIAHSHLDSRLTPWQSEQKIDFKANTGATKFKNHLDAASMAGLAFCASAIIIFISYKIQKKR